MTFSLSERRELSPRGQLLYFRKLLEVSESRQKLAKANNGAPPNSLPFHAVDAPDKPRVGTKSSATNGNESGMLKTPMAYLNTTICAAWKASLIDLFIVLAER